MIRGKNIISLVFTELKGCSRYDIYMFHTSHTVKKLTHPTDFGF